MVEISIAEKDKDVQHYPDGYIVARDGIYQKTTNGWISHMTKVDGIPEIAEMEDKTFLKIKLPKIPFGILLDAWDFFREVSYVHDAEAIVLLTYDERKYSLVVPKQDVSGVSLRYETDGCVNVIGTIHSHNTMSAFHSGTDDRDEEKMDGIHITLGNVKESFPSMSCSATKNGERFMFRVDSLFEFADTTRSLSIDDGMTKVEKMVYSSTKKSAKEQSYFGTYSKTYDDDYDSEGAYAYGVGGNFTTWSSQYRDEYL